MAKLLAVALAAAAVGADAAEHRPVSWAGLLSLTEGESKANPVTKVVGLLRDMTVELAADQRKDDATYEKMQCWCDDGKDIKAKTIADAKQHIVELGPMIEGHVAKSAQLAIDLDTARAEKKKSEASLKEAQALRYKEAENFMQEERDAEDTIRGCKMALKVLSSNHDGAFPQEALIEARQALRKTKAFAPEQVERLKLAPKDKKAVMSLLSRNPHLQEYAPQSGELVGMLKTMLDEFEDNLKTIREAEENAKATFADLKPAKEKEIRASTRQIREKLGLKVKADEAAESGKLDLTQTKNRQAAEEKALADLEEDCPKMDQEYQTRTKYRQDEQKAVGEAITILTDDDARDSMQHSLTFLQLSASRRASAPHASSVAAKLQEVAKKFAHPELALLAVAVKEDVFGKVKESIVKMVENLKQEEKDEFKQKDYCKGELHDIQLQLDDKNHDKDQQTAKAADLESQIATLTEDIRVATAAIVKTKIEMKRSLEAREAEFKEFAVIRAEQQHSIETLNKAVAKLRAFYGPSLMQESATTTSTSSQEQPAFEKQEKHSGGGKVMNMIGEIIKESKAEMLEVVTDEHESQTAYESYNRQQNKAIAAREKEIMEKTEQKSKADGDLISTKEDLAQTNKDLEEIHEYAGGVHKECDFLLNNFQARRDARSEEIDALNEAMAMMSGR